MSDRISFLDTNVLLRHIMQDNADHSPRSTALIRDIQDGRRSVQIADTVIFEAAYALEKIYLMPRLEIRDSLLEFIELPSVVFQGKVLFREVFDLFVNNPGLSIADCFHLELARRFTNGAICSFDRRFGTVEGITRFEP
jgi:predicted nucleic acid-binding protein